MGGEAAGRQTISHHACGNADRTARGRGEVRPELLSEIPKIASLDARNVGISSINRVFSLLGSSEERTLAKVSSDGIPCGGERNVSNQLRLALPYPAISLQPSAPHITAKHAITR